MIEQLIKYYPSLLKALIETFVMVGIATIIGILLGFTLGVLLYITKKNSLKENKTFNIIISLFVNIFRSIPFMLLAIIILPFTRLIIGKGIGSIAASVPLSLVSISLFARFTEQAFDTISPNLIKSGKAMGANTMQIIWFIGLSEALPNLVLGYTSAIISLISFSTALGVVGGGGIGDFGISYGYVNNLYDLMLIVIIIMIIIVQFIQFFGNRLASYVNKK